MNILKTRKLVIGAMFSAIYVVAAAILTVDLPGIKFSLSSVPIILSALLLGVPDCLAVSFCGAFIDQMLYGLGPTTILWLIPPVIQSLFVGLFKNKIENNNIRMVLVIVTAEFLLTFVNTAAVIVDSKIIGYSIAALAVLLPTRIINGCARAVCSASVAVILLPTLKKILGRSGEEK